MISVHMAMVQNQWCHVGIGAPPILVYFSGGDVHWGHFRGFDNHGHLASADFGGLRGEPAWPGT